MEQTVSACWDSGYPDLKNLATDQLSERYQPPGPVLLGGRQCREFFHELDELIFKVAILGCFAQQVEDVDRSRFAYFSIHGITHPKA